MGEWSLIRWAAVAGTVCFVGKIATNCGELVSVAAVGAGKGIMDFAKSKKKP